MVGGTAGWDLCVVRWREARGQTSVEWLVVSGVVVALAGFLLAGMPALASPITSTVGTIVCKVGGGGCHGSSGPRSGSGDGPEGPAIGDGMPIRHVPGLGEGDTFSAKTGGAFTVTVERTIGNCTVDGSGNPSVTLSTSLDFNLTGKAGEIKKGNGAELSLTLGKKTSYSVNADPATARAIERGDVRPNPVDPGSIPVGAAITMSKESYRGQHGAIAYRHIQADLDYTSGHRVSSSVQRTDANHVRVTIGDSDFVQNTIGLGAGPVGFSQTHGFEDGKARSIDIDISTPAGRTAYHDFIKNGVLPRSGTRATSGATSSTSTTDSSSHQATLDLGRFGISKGGSSVNYENVETVHADGSRERNVFVRRGDTIMSTHYDLDRGGRITGQSFALHLQHIDHDSVDGFQNATGHHGPAGGDRDISLSFDAGDVRALQNAALDQLIASQVGHGGPFDKGATRGQMADYLRAHPDGGALRGTRPALDRMLPIAAAKVPDDVIRALLARSQGSPEALLDFLTQFANATKAARHKLGSHDTSSPLTGGYANRPPGC
jgi:hypothetical protein